MERIPIKKRQNIFVVEKYHNKCIQPQSRIYCGVCGEIIGININHLEFPFMFNTLKNNLKNPTVRESIMGIHHSTCGHTITGNSKELKFCTIEAYMAQYHKQSNTTKS